MKKIDIFTSSAGIDPLCSKLDDIGVEGVQITDSADFNDFLQNQTQYWDYIDESLEPLRDCETRVTVYLEDGDSADGLQGRIRAAVAELKQTDSAGEFGRLEVESEDIPDVDWLENWKEYYKPFKLGNKLLIKPEWDSLGEEDNPDGRVVLNMNPGHLFGTGTHHSTQLCLLELEKHIRNGDKMLDLGCGSGILAIVSLLLGASSAVAADIDPAAPHILAENLALNDLPVERCEVFVGDVTNDDELCRKLGGGFDVIAANIVADVIIALCPKIPPMLKRGGYFVTSGIIDSREDEVLRAIEAVGLEVVNTSRQGGWSCITATAR